MVNKVEMVLQDSPMKIVTHAGSFHADDVTAFVVLKAALGYFTLERTRDSTVISAADIAFDVGGIYNPAAGRFDHHQRGAPLRPDGQPYSSAGLVWREYGRRALAAWNPDADEAAIEAVWTALDRDVMLPLDLIDNGHLETDSLNYAALIAVFNPSWDEAPDYQGPFFDAARMAEAILQRQALAAFARLRAHAVVVAACASASDPRIVELPRSMPWHEVVHAEGLPTLYAIYPDAAGTGFLVNAMPSAPGKFDQKRPLPAAWAGLRGQALADLTGVADATFCHNARFICGAVSLDGARALAQAALAD